MKKQSYVGIKITQGDLGGDARVSPRLSAKGSPRGSPKGSPKGSQKGSPNGSPVINSKLAKKKTMFWEIFKENYDD